MNKNNDTFSISSTLISGLLNPIFSIPMGIVLVIGLLAWGYETMKKLYFPVLPQQYTIEDLIGAGVMGAVGIAAVLFTYFFTKAMISLENNLTMEFKPAGNCAWIWQEEHYQYSTTCRKYVDTNNAEEFKLCPFCTRPLVFPFEEEHELELNLDGSLN